MIASKNSPPQSSSPPLVVHFASGRLAARLTPYVLLLLLQVLNFDVNAVVVESINNNFPRKSTD